MNDLCRMNVPPSITKDFNFLSRTYTAVIWHVEDLSAEQREQLSITKDSFYVHISGAGKDIYFELYIAEDLEWYSGTEFDGPDEFVALTGKIIDDHYG